MSVELLSRVFVDTLGKQQHSIFSHLQSFENIERDMRREMDNLRAMVHRDLQLEVSTAHPLYKHTHCIHVAQIFVGLNFCAIFGRLNFVDFLLGKI